MTDYRASHMHARMTARKARLAMDMIRGLSVNRAIDVLAFTPRRSARLVEKVLKSAVANASQDEAVNVNRLVVSEARVDEGPLLGGRGRWRPGPRGRVMPYKKRTSHIYVWVAEAPESVLSENPAPAAVAEAESES